MGTSTSYFKTTLFSFLLVFSSLNSLAQSDSLQLRYERLMNRSENYQKYKVIVKQDLESMWNEVQDTMGVYQKRLSQEKKNVISLKNEIADQAGEITTLREQVAGLEDQVDSIGFLGIDFSKSSYHTMVWSIIILLVVAVIMIYSMTLRSRLLTKSTTADLRAVQLEFEDFKERARAREVKVKRELQTAINNLEEFKRGVKK